MTLQEYYNIIIDKYSNQEYTIKGRKGLDKPELNPKEFPLYAINYIIFEYLRDNKDNRWKLILDWVVVPNGVNQAGCDLDFTKINFNELFNFMLKAKT